MQQPDPNERTSSTFPDSRERWLNRSTHVRNIVRQEMISRQLRRHIRPAPASVLDVGAGQGLQSIRLAREGHDVLAIEPDATLRAAFVDALHQEPDDVQRRVTLQAGELGQLEELCSGRRFDAVLLLGVLMYLPMWTPALAEVSARVAGGGILSVAARTRTSALWRPAARQDWVAAAQALAEYDDAVANRRDMNYTNEIGSLAHAQDFAALVAAPQNEGLEFEEWYGVRVAVDLAEQDPAAAYDDGQWVALLQVEERLGSMDPYRQLAQLAHLIWRRPT